MKVLQTIYTKSNVSKIVLGLVAMLLLSAFFVSQTAYADFNDFNESSSGGKEVMYLTGKEIIYGYPDGSFRPETNITRMQAVTMLGRALGWNAYSTEKVFADVSTNNSANGYVVEAYKKGITVGYPNNEFRPNELLTRAQMAAFLNRAFDYQTHFKKTFTDVSSSYWAYADVQAVATNGIVMGHLDGSFQPNSNTSRRHFSMMLSRAVEPSFVPTMLLQTVVDASMLNVRTQPTVNSNILGKLAHGEVVEFKPTDVKGWGKVKKEGLEGYAALAYLQEYVPGNEITQPEVPVTASLPLKNKIIVVDPGHGGSDGGAADGGLVEKTINLKTSLFLKSKLAELGAIVYMTRDRDVALSLEERAAFAEKKNADIFISVHTNASASGAAHGSETFYNDQIYAGKVNPYPINSKLLASSIQREMAKLPTKDNGVKQQAFLVLRYNSVPSVLVELAFINNGVDASLLRDDNFLKQAASSISTGVLNYYK